jgi:hypothetical protein
VSDQTPASLQQSIKPVMLAREVGELLRCGLRTVYAMFDPHRGPLTGYRVGKGNRGVRIHGASVLRLLEGGVEPNTPPPSAPPAKKPRQGGEGSGRAFGGGRFALRPPG